MLRKFLVTGVTFALLLSAVPAFAFDVPAHVGYITDIAQILKPEEKSALEHAIDSYKTQTSNEIGILIVPSLNGEDIADTAVQVGRSWGIGGKEKDNGVLILIAINDHQLFIATGYGLEGALPDIVAKGIIETDMLPAFREQKYFDGIAAGINSIEKHIGGEYSADRYGSSDDGSAWGNVFVFFLIMLQLLGAFLGRTKSWWLGGVLGAVSGIVLGAVFGWWMWVPLLAVFGLVFDYIVSKFPGGRGGFFTGGGRFGGGSSGGGSFGGGSFGGGGAGGHW